MVDDGNHSCHIATMVVDLTPFEALCLATDTLGSQGKLARVCGVSSTAVWKWLQSSKRLPAEHVLNVEAATGISRHHLRPDIYPLDLPPAPARWFGNDRRIGARTNGVDRRTGRVALQSNGKSKGLGL